jgi:hypothetical protein
MGVGQSSWKEDSFSKHEKSQTHEKAENAHRARAAPEKTPLARAAR